MKIIAVLEVSITSGGGFNQALNTVQQLSNLLEEKFDFGDIPRNDSSVCGPVRPAVGGKTGRRLF